MFLKDRLASDLKEAIRSSDERRKTAIRLVTAAVKNAEVAQGSPLDDTGVLKVISKEVGRHRESIEQFQKGGRQDLVDQEEAELAVLLSYLPPAMSRDEIVQAARQVISQVEARGPADKGKVMPVLIAQLAGRAEGREINEVVTGLLAELSRP
ncbi:MAG: GatB/YqeY domain-containing protein [Chloroflexota bacterium]|nr:GatB/YqeY domain-containing protein [Chloroflexota bacterium]